MKKLLFTLVACLVAIAANATIYVVGAGDGLNWTLPGKAYEAQSDGTYVLQINNLTQFKFATASYTEWDDKDGVPGFNSNAYATGNATFGDDVYQKGQTLPIEHWGENQNLPWKGNYTITIDMEKMTMTALTNTPKPTGSPEVYFRGDMNGWLNSGAQEAWKFTNTNWNGTSGEWTWTGTIKAGQGFKIADMDWDAVNYTTNNTKMNGTEAITYPLSYNSGDNAKFASEFTGTVTLKITNYSGHQATVTFTPSGAEVTYPDNVYILGNVDGAGWSPNNGTKVEGNGKGVYTINNVHIENNDGTDYGYISFTEALSTVAGNWDVMGTRWGATTEDQEPEMDKAIEMASNGGSTFSFKLQTGNYDITIDLVNTTVTFHKIVEVTPPGPVEPDPDVPAGPFDVTFDFTNFDNLVKYTPGVPSSDTWTADSPNKYYNITGAQSEGITITSNGTEAGKTCVYYFVSSSNSYNFRVYQNYTFTITAPKNGVLNSIAFTGTSANKISADAGTVSGSTSSASWAAPEGGVASVTFTVTSTFAAYKTMIIKGSVAESTPPTEETTYYLVGNFNGSDEGWSDFKALNTANNYTLSDFGTISEFKITDQAGWDGNEWGSNGAAITLGTAYTLAKKEGESTPGNLGFANGATLSNGKIVLDPETMAITVTGTLPEFTTMYIVGANINGTAEWDQNAPMTTTDGKKYEWTGTELGSGFKFNNGGWNDANFNIGAKAGATNVALNTPFTYFASGDSKDMTFDGFKVTNPKVVLDMEAGTVTVTGTQVFVDMQWYLTGLNETWKLEEPYELKPVEGQENVFAGTFEITATSGQVQVAGTGWNPKYGNADLTITESNLSGTLNDITNGGENAKYNLPVGNYYVTWNASTHVITFDMVQDIDTPATWAIAGQLNMELTLNEDGIASWKGTPGPGSFHVTKTQGTSVTTYGPKDAPKNPYDVGFGEWPAAENTDEWVVGFDKFNNEQNVVINFDTNSLVLSIALGTTEEPSDELDVTFDFTKIDNWYSYNSSIPTYGTGGWTAGSGANIYTFTGTLESEGFEIDLQKGTAANNQPYIRYGTSGVGSITLRIYSGNTLAVSAPEGYNLSDIVYDSNITYLALASDQPGTYSNGTWTAPEGQDVNTVVFTNNSSAAGSQCTIKTITINAVKASEGEEPGPEVPSTDKVFENGTLNSGATLYNWWNDYTVDNAENPLGEGQVIKMVPNARSAANDYSNASFGILLNNTNGVLAEMADQYLNFDWYAEGPGTYSVKLTAVVGDEEKAAKEVAIFEVTPSEKKNLKSGAAGEWHTASVNVAETFPEVASFWKSGNPTAGYVFSMVLNNGDQTSAIYLNNIYYGAQVQEEQPEPEIPADAIGQLVFDDITETITLSEATAPYTITKDVEVRLQLDQNVNFAYKGFQFDITLPEGFTLETATANPLLTTTTPSVELQKNGAYRVLSYFDNEAESTNTAIEYLVKLNIQKVYDALPAAGTYNYKATIDNTVVFSTEEGQDITQVAGSQSDVTIIVNQGKVPVTAINITAAKLMTPSYNNLDTYNSNMVTYVTSGQQVQLEWNVAPANATVQTVTWSTNNDNVKVNSGIVTTAGITAETKVTLTATADDQSGVTATYEFTVKPILLGDANDNGYVTVSDVVTIANFIATKPSKVYDQPNADFDANGDIDVNDINATINVIMGGAETPKSIRRQSNVMTNDMLVSNNFKVAGSEPFAIGVGLENNINYASLQALVTLPEGMELVEVTKGARAAGHHLVYNTRFDGRIVVVLYSDRNESFNKLDGELFNIVVKAQADCGNISIDRIKASDAAANGYVLTHKGGNNVTSTTGVDGIDAVEEGVRYFTVDGIEVMNPEAGQILIRVSGNKVEKVVM